MLAKKSRANLRLRSRGASAVELALLFPFLMAIFFAIVEFGFVLYDKAMITNAAREGARYGIVLRSVRYTPDQIKNRTQEYCNAKLISMGGSNTCTAFVCRNDAACTTHTGASWGTAPKFEDKLTVRVTYSYQSTGLLYFYNIVAGAINLESKATMVFE